ARGEAPSRCNAEPRVLRRRGGGGCCPGVENRGKRGRNRPWAQKAVPWESLLVPEIEQDHLARVVAQLEGLAVLVLTFDVRRLLADAQVADLEQLPFGLPTDRAPFRELDLAVFFHGLLEERFGLLAGFGAVLPLQFLQVLLAEQTCKFAG